MAMLCVQEILKAEYNQEIAYSTLTRLTREMNCRQPPVRFGEYIYEPGAEMQHDTSPHKSKIRRKNHSSTVCCFSTRI